MLRDLHMNLGIPASWTPPCDCFDEASELVDVELNLVGRMQRLTPSAATAWQKMVKSAASDGVRLLMVSGFRSYAYQAGLIEQKLAAGRSIDDILTVNAAPGYSEHHTGRAVDIATPGSRPLTEEFEKTEAFSWLTMHAAGLGFRMSYPRNNPEGYIFEPWHWCFVPKT